MFSRLARWFSAHAGSSQMFFLALLAIIIWACLGPLVNYSDSWQLVINTATTIITFLMVFIIQNTQNRDMVAIQLKLDEIICSIKAAKNELVDIENLTDKELEVLQKQYTDFAAKCRRKGSEKDSRGH